MGLWLGLLGHVFWLCFRGDLGQVGKCFVIGRDNQAAFWADVINLTRSTLLPLRYLDNNGRQKGEVLARNPPIFKHWNLARCAVAPHLINEGPIRSVPLSGRIKLAGA